jgi:hypothetical protein
LRIAGLLVHFGGLTVCMAGALLDALREAFTMSDAEQNDDRQFYDTDLIGEYNHRTGLLDAGNDPYGWYDED